MANRTASTDRAAGAWQVARVVAVLALIVLAERVGDHALKPDEATAIIVALVLAAIFVALTPDVIKRLSTRVQKVSLGPVGVEMVGEAETAAAETTSDESDTDQVGELLELRFTLEKKLAYIAKHIVDDNGKRAFVTIGDLRSQQLLTDEQARTATRVLTLDEERFGELPSGSRDAFLQATSKLAGNVRAEVLNALVRKRLTSTGWEIADIPRGGKRPDMLVAKGDRRVRLATIMADDAGSDLLKAAKERLGKKVDSFNVDLTVIVIPHTDENQSAETDDNPKVVRLRNMFTALER